MSFTEVSTCVGPTQVETSSSSTGKRYEAKSNTKRLQKELTTGPQTLIVGDGAVNKTKHFFSKTPKYFVLPMIWCPISQRKFWKSLLSIRQ